jgi:uncharacterized protein (DUF2147 family)
MKFYLIIFAFSVIFIPVFSQADDILGYWLTEEGDSQIQIFKTPNGKYSGKVAWMKTEKDKKDDKNPDLKLKDRKIMGLQILNNFMYNARQNEWAYGTIYDPKNGKSYDCYLWFEDDKNIMKIKGFVLGMRFLGRQTSWKKEVDLRK